MKTYELLKQAIEKLTEAETVAIEEREYIPAINIGRAKDEAEQALERTLDYQMQLAADLVASWQV